VHTSSVALAAGLALILSGSSFAQSTTTTTAPPVSCAEILAMPSASAEEIAALSDTSAVRVQECRDADNTAANAPGVSDLRTAVAANTTIAPALTAAGVVPERLVAVRRDESGAFSFYMIGAFR
jgi:hypothetical protein